MLGLTCVSVAPARGTGLRGNVRLLFRLSTLPNDNLEGSRARPVIVQRQSSYRTIGLIRIGLILISPSIIQA